MSSFSILADGAVADDDDADDDDDDDDAGDNGIAEGLHSQTFPKGRINIFPPPPLALKKRF